MVNISDKDLESAACCVEDCLFLSITAFRLLSFGEVAILSVLCLYVICVFCSSVFGHKNWW